jgi:hypothetical protein
MSTITMARANVTSEALRDGLGPGYNVQPGMRMVSPDGIAWIRLANARATIPNTASVPRQHRADGE